MIVNKDEFKRLKKDSGGFRGADCMVVATLLSGINEIKNVSAGTLELRESGLFFDIIMGKKIFIPISKISSAKVGNGAIEINIKDNEYKTKVLFSVEKESDLNKLYNCIMKRMGLLGVDNLKPIHEIKNQKDEHKEDNNEVRCPKCSSTQLNIQKKGMGVGKAFVGHVIAGPLGLLAGGIGKNNIEITCLKCGHKFKPGKK